MSAADVETDEELERQAAEFADTAPSGAIRRVVPVAPLPHDLDAEVSVLGALLLSAEAVDRAVGTALDARHFYSPAHGIVFEGICRVVAAGGRPDAVTVAAAITDEEKGRAGGAKEVKRLLVSLIASCPSTSNVTTYVSIVVDLAELRELVGAGLAMADAARGGDRGRVAEILAAAHRPARSSAWVDRLASARIDWGEFWTARAADWLVEPLLARGRGHAMFARAKLGKSLLALDVAASLAAGRAVLDQPAGDPVDVLYIDAEMTRDDLRERLEDMGYGPEVDLSRLHYYSLPSLPPLDTPEGGQAVVSLAAYHRAQVAIIDTVARTVAGAENDADTFREYARCTGQLLKAAGVTVLRVDHGGKEAEKGQRGSSAKDDDVDVVWRLTAADAGRLILTATHRRMSWVPQTVTLRRTESPLGHAIEHAAAWPAGTAECATRLTELSVPLDASRRIAADALRGAGDRYRNDTISAALRARRTMPEDPL